MGRARVLNGLRATVVTTAGLPILRRAYEAVYELQKRRVARLPHVDGVESLFIRGSSPDRVSPGLSDIDLFTVLDDSRPAAIELAAIETIARYVRSINRGAPLIREVHAFTRTELAFLGDLSGDLYARVLHDAAPIFDPVALPPLTTDPRTIKDELLRQACFRAARTLSHLYEGGVVGSGLAARAHAKCLDALAQLELGDFTVEKLREAHVTSSRVPVDLDGVLSLLRRIDALLPDAPEIQPSAPFAPHPTIEAASGPVREWFRALGDTPALTGALLSAEGARLEDLRFFLMLDPEHRGAKAALVRIGRALRRRPFPTAGFSRAPAPIVLTPEQCSRSVFQRWTPTEAFTRGSHGLTIAGDAIVARATTEEMARALVVDWLGDANRVRELLAGTRTTRNERCFTDALLGSAPALETLATTGRLLTTPRHAHEDARALLDSLRTRNGREAALDRLRAVAGEVCPKVLRVVREGLGQETGARVTALRDGPA